MATLTLIESPNAAQAQSPDWGAARPRDVERYGPQRTFLQCQRERDGFREELAGKSLEEIHQELQRQRQQNEQLRRYDRTDPICWNALQRQTAGLEEAEKIYEEACIRAIFSEGQ